MTNIEKIQQMQPKQLANEIFNLINGCAGLYDMCAYHKNGKCEYIHEKCKPCKNGIQKWLETDNNDERI